MSPIQRTTFEIAPADHGWIVERHGFGRDSTHNTKEAALRRAVKLARGKQPSELVIRRLDGSVQETRLYGSISAMLRSFLFLVAALSVVTVPARAQGVSHAARAVDRRIDNPLMRSEVTGLVPDAGRSGFRQYESALPCV